MPRFAMRHCVIVAASVTVLGIVATAASSHDPAQETKTPAGGSKISKVFEQMLPKGDFQKVGVITVDYVPGGTTPKHRHDVAVFAYVVDGKIESQLAGEELKTFSAGEMWYESPGTVHLVSRNASKEKPAKLLVFFVQEEGKAPTTFVK
ncbi:MAG TPA: cupin domain-containing protein [Pirellulales bacterium]